LPSDPWAAQESNQLDTINTWSLGATQALQSSTRATYAIVDIGSILTSTAEVRRSAEDAFVHSLGWHSSALQNVVEHQVAVHGRRRDISHVVVFELDECMMLRLARLFIHSNINININKLARSR